MVGVGIRRLGLGCYAESKWSGILTLTAILLRAPASVFIPTVTSSEEEGSVERERECKRARRSSDFCPSSSSGDLEGELF